MTEVMAPIDRERSSSRVAKIAKQLGLCGAALVAAAGISASTTHVDSRLGPYQLEVSLRPGMTEINTGILGKYYVDTGMVGVEANVVGVGAPVQVGQTLSPELIASNALIFSNPDGVRDQLFDDLATGYRDNFVAWFGAIGVGLYLGRKLLPADETKRRKLLASAVVAGSVANLSSSTVGRQNDPQLTEHTIGNTIVYTDTDNPFVPVVDALLNGVNKLVNEGEIHDKLYRDKFANTLDYEALRGGNFEQLLLFSDNHCQAVTAETAGIVRKFINPAMTIVLGDTTNADLEFEKSCVKYEAGQTGLSMWASGDHDGPNTTETLKDIGVKVLSGQVISINGIPVLGAGAPERKTDPFSTKVTYEDGKTSADIGEQLLEVARKWPADEAPLLVMGHKPEMVQPIADAVAAGEPLNVNLIANGHMHKHGWPIEIGESGVLKMSLGALGGVGTSTVGNMAFPFRIPEARISPPNSDSYQYIVELDKATKKLARIVMIETATDGAASVHTLFDDRSSFIRTSKPGSGMNKPALK